ncbi:MAG: OmpA family protein [Gammaproteobacteria bacterium]|nr:OmpA family protein [Gammaproteobacteria bacterium]
MASLFAACSSVPSANTALDQARDRYEAAQRDSQITSLAAEELKQAGQSLSAAMQAWEDQEPNATVDHLAYMTLQHVVVAEETALGRAAQAVTAGAAAERERMRLALRTGEADRARADLAESQRRSDLMATAQAEADAAAKREEERKDARVAELEAQLVALNAKKTDRGMVLTLGDVLFDTGQAQIRAEGARNMQKLAEFLKRYPEARASIEGHTDSVGSAASNYSLAQRRADSVHSALRALGVPAASLSTRAHGPDIPVATNETASGRQMNRRVEIVFANDVAGS